MAAITAPARVARLEPLKRKAAQGVDGPIAQTVENVTAAGAVYFSVAALTPARAATTFYAVTPCRIPPGRPSQRSSIRLESGMQTIRGSCTDSSSV